MKVTYTGPYSAVTVSALDHRLVAKGDEIEVADDLGRTLLAQGWTSDDTPLTVDEILAQVDGDPTKAAEALAIEQASSKPRKSLIAQLTKLAETDHTEVTP